MATSDMGTNITRNYNWEMGLMGTIYFILQAFVLRLPIDPFIDYYNHIGWGIGFEDGLYPYRDFVSNEYPVLSVWGWIASYMISPVRNYYWLSFSMNAPYWFVAAIGGLCLYRLLVEYGINDKAAFGLANFFLFLPLNLVDTVNNHGTLGTLSTVILAVYLWERQKYCASAAFVAAGFSIKLFPIYVAPFLVWALPKFLDMVRYSIYFITWLIIFHLPVLFIFPDYFDALFWRTTNWGGISYGVVFGMTGEFFGFEQLSTVVWIGGLAICTLILCFEDNLNHLEKYTILQMTNNLLEYQGGIGHIANALPFMAIYFFYENSNRQKKWGFIAYLVGATSWAFDRIFFDIRHTSDLIGITTMGIMIAATTLLFYHYVLGLVQIN